jgi:hypothetical protein
MSWLATRPDAVRTLTPKVVLDALPQFEAEKQRLTRDWGGNLPWADLVLAAFEISRSRQVW